MSNPDNSVPQNEERVGPKTKKRLEELELRVKELERVAHALVEAIVEAEDELGETLMKKGTFCGIEFSDD